MVVQKLEFVTKKVIATNLEHVIAMNNDRQRYANNVIAMNIRLSKPYAMSQECYEYHYDRYTHTYFINLVNMLRTATTNVSEKYQLQQYTHFGRTEAIEIKGLTMPINAIYNCTNHRPCSIILWGWHFWHSLVSLVVIAGWVVMRWSK